MAEARAHFADHCASCHGNDGSGQTQLGRRLYPRAPDMRLPATQALSDGELFHVIENGIRFTGMPGWGGGVSPEVSWKLVLFIRHLPRLAPEEILEMERLNPKSPSEWREFQQDQEFLQSSPAGPVEGRSPFPLTKRGVHMSKPSLIRSCVTSDRDPGGRACSGA